MFEQRKKRRQLENQIRDVEGRIHRTAEIEHADMLTLAVVNFRWEKERYHAALRQLDTDAWIERAKKHHIKVPSDEADYWQTIDIDQATKQTLLTTEGRHFIKTAIHEKRFRLIQQWGWLIASLVAILSLIVSIFAFLKK